MKAMVVVLALGLVAMATAEEPAALPPVPPEVTAALDTIKDAKTIELSTAGRKTGKTHTRPVWFVVDGGKIIVQAGKDGKTDWYRNLLAHPEATLRQGEYTIRAAAAPVNDPAEVERIHALFTQKYTVAWLGSLVGSSLGRGRPVELKLGAVSVARPKT